MTDREKVIKGLECCVKHDEDFKTSSCSSLNCPCLDDCAFKNYFVKTSLMRDALELLKEQEENDSEWLEDSDPGQEYGTTWACRVCGHSLHLPYVWNPYEVNLKFCPWCGKGDEKVMNDADFKQIEANLKDALEYEQQLNRQIMGRLDAYENILRMLLKLLICEVKEGR